MLRTKIVQIRVLALLLGVTMLFPAQTSYAAAIDQNVISEMADGTLQESEPAMTDAGAEYSTIPETEGGAMQESEPAKSDATAEHSDEPETEDGTMPESEPAKSDAAAEKILTSPSDGQPDNDGKIYIEGNLYNGYYMDNDGLLYTVSNGIPELYTGIVSASAKYYYVNQARTFPRDTLYVQGKLYSGYYMDKEYKMYYAKKGSLTLKTGIVPAKTQYYNGKEYKVQKLKKQTLYVKGKLYSGYYMDRKNKMYYAKKGSLTLKSGTVSAKTKYYSDKENKTKKLKKQTLYVKGKLYSGYYMDRKNKMYQVKKGLLTLKTGTVPAKTKYYSGKANKTQKLKKQKLYVKGKLYSGYFLNGKNVMYRAKKGAVTPVSKLLGGGTKYYSYKGKKTRKLTKQTLYVRGKLYTGYYMDNENKMYQVKKGTCTLVNTILAAGTAYYNHNTGTMRSLQKQTLYINGTAMEGMSAESLATLQRAQAVVARITNESMTKEQKLKICFDYVKDAYPEIKPRIPHYTGMDWPVVYANDMFVRGAGNCCSYAAAFAYMAKAIGYEQVYCCNSGGHGWAEIDGLVYDPEWSKWHHVYNYFALSYNTKTDQDYKGAIGAGKPWMRIKI